MDNSEGQLPGQSSRESAPGRPSMPGRAEAKSSDPSGPETPIASQLDKSPWLFKKRNQMVVRPRDGGRRGADTIVERWGASVKN